MNLNCLLVYLKKRNWCIRLFFTSGRIYKCDIIQHVHASGLDVSICPLHLSNIQFQNIGTLSTIRALHECVFIHDHGWFTFSVYIISVGYAFVLDPPKKEKREPWPPKISASLLLQAAIHRSEGPVPSTEGDKKRGGLLMGFWWILWWHQRILAYQCSKKHAYHAKTDVEFVCPFGVAMRL